MILREEIPGEIAKILEKKNAFEAWELCAMLEAGFMMDQKEIKDIVIENGLDIDLWKKLTNGYG